MLCLTNVITGLMSLGAIFVLSFGAKKASQLYQRRRQGWVDEGVAVNWQNRAALVGILFVLANILSRCQFSVVTD